MLLKVLLFFYFILFSSSVFSKEIPVIVISAGKTPQSYSSIGSQVTIIDSKIIEQSSESFLTDLLGNEVQGLNIFQLGGKGTNTGIQLRGLPKRYSTVYIDGVKMNDPSASDNGFYSQGIMIDSIDRIEILKGSQSSLYGNGAVGGTINIFTKKGKLGKHQNAIVRAGENNTKDVFLEKSFNFNFSKEVFSTLKFLFKNSKPFLSNISEISTNVTYSSFKSPSILFNFSPFPTPRTITLSSKLFFIL